MTVRPYLVFAAAFAAGCGHFRLAVKQCPISTVEGTGPKAVVQYLGTGGYLVKFGGRAVLFGPHYSNPSIVEVALNHDIATDASLVDLLFPAEAADASAILVGHSHYDHFMDVPYVALHRATRASIYTSATGRNLIAPVVPAIEASGRRVVAVDPYTGSFLPAADSPPGIRILPIRSEHSDQVTVSLPFGLATWPVHMFRGEVEHTAYEKLPRTPSEWKEGKVFAFLVDFLDERKSVQFRVYYQDSGANPPFGLVPRELVDDKRVDVALLCAGGDVDRIKDHPETIIANARPRFVVVGHWEDLFRTQRTPCDEQKDCARKVHAIPRARLSLRQLIGDTETEHFLHRVQGAMKGVAQQKHYKDRGLAWIPCPTQSRFELPVEGGIVVPGVDPGFCSRFGRARSHCDSLAP